MMSKHLGIAAAAFLTISLSNVTAFSPSHFSPSHVVKVGGIPSLLQSNSPSSSTTSTALNLYKKTKWTPSGGANVAIPKWNKDQGYDGGVSYAPQQEGLSNNIPTTYGELLTNAGGMTDICAFNAASTSITNKLSKNGSVSADDIHNQIALANEVVSLVQYHFPGSLGSSEILRRVQNVLDEMDLINQNILLTQSVCPDEINHEKGDITDLFIENIGGGKVFHLGGLAGVPFTGKTGFGAYSGHVEDHGHCFVLQAPHIGMSNELQFGEYSRDGQASAGHACGAAVGAMCHCAAGNPMPHLDATPNDYQMAFLIQEIGKRMDSLQYITDENSKQAELVRQTSHIGREMLDECLHTNFGDENSMLFVLTGIQINMPFEFEDYFQPLSFEIRKKDGSVIDLFQQTFGM